MKKILNKGFTLIELLVVVAIIGILASVVLASLNTARAKGANAAIKANLANIRAQAEIVYDKTPNAYGSSNGSNCLSGLFSEPTIKAAVAAAVTASGVPTSGACYSTTGTESAWAVSVLLKATEGTFAYWCVDSTGVSKGTASAASSTVCPE
jgi:prepilin-type N-terminal cleavage/methylation domain-containing protein